MNTDGHAPGRDGWLGPVRERIGDLCITCVEATGTDGGGVSLRTVDGTREVVYATGRAAASLENLQVLLGEGPCIDAALSPGPVLVDDLTDPGEGVAGRWPLFLAEARALPVRALYAFPIRVGPVPLGSFELSRARPGPLQQEQLRSALVTADALGTALTDLGDMRADGAGPATRSARVHQAAGMVMVQLGCSVEDAMARLRAAAYAEGGTLEDVASDVIARRRRFAEERR